jgi:hypothetical protein
MKKTTTQYVLNTTKSKQTQISHVSAEALGG